MSTPARARSRLITAEEFAQLPDARRYELVRGELREMSPTNEDHGEVASQMAYLLQLWRRRHGRGHVRVETGHLLSRAPDTVRGPDVSFLRRPREEGSP